MSTTPPRGSADGDPAASALSVELAVGAPDDSGGDPVCWMHLVCPECGRIGDGADARCPHCGRAM